MAERAETEIKRRELATDTEFWLCLCFRREADKAAFLAKTGLRDARFVSGEELERAVGPFTPSDKPKKSFARPTIGSIRVPNPLADVQEGATMEEGCLAETRAILAAFRSPEEREEYRSASDSHIWICAAFRDRASVEGFLDRHSLRRYGDKYLDASAWLAAM